MMKPQKLQKAVRPGADSICDRGCHDALRAVSEEVEGGQGKEAWRQPSISSDLHTTVVGQETGGIFG